ncbi:MAG: hypothetical protein H6613_09545 [Ignavibacteriales bacterium]|nr:hypothetical protein [Ignavibacteriales bacterium]
MYSPDGKEVFGSLRDYYSIMSDGNLELTGYILNEDLNKDNVPDWIMLDNTKEYYNAERGKNLEQKQNKKQNH